MAKKTWIEKRDAKKEFIIKRIDKRFADMPEGCKMFIATPKIVDEYVKCIEKGNEIDIPTMRNDLAIEYGAEKTCPVTSSIFLRTVAEAALEELEQGKPIEEITPFWRMMTPKDKIAKKLSCGVDFIQKQREKEGLL
ncbi:hypothetical protein [Pseudofulvibacter geojedonensis]|uniref:Uncharacterized protein n=1 Tax=Pseudofulvibacter geojedonensis TaxID=1123758 RepID=A0ABW3I2W7_9FLAO